MLLPTAAPLRICRAGTLALSLRAACFPSVPGHHLSQASCCSSIIRRMSAPSHDSTSPSGAAAAAGDRGQAGGLREQKKSMRKRIKSELKAIDEEAAGAASAAVAERLLACPQLQTQGGGGAVSVYLSMPAELGTSAIVSGLFKLGWKVYIPKVQKERPISPLPSHRPRHLCMEWTLSRCGRRRVFGVVVCTMHATTATCRVLVYF